MRNSQPKLVVTGFGPFQEFDRNPSQDIAQRADGQIFHGIQVVGLSLQVSWKRAWPQVQKAVFRHKPVGLLMFGLAPGHWFRFERTAINRNEPYFDIDHLRPSAPQIIAEGAETIESTLPLGWLFGQMQEWPGPQIPEIRYSDDAGGYLCNQVFYQAMNRLEHLVSWRGFIHVPGYSPDGFQADFQLAESEILEAGLFLTERFACWIAGQNKSGLVEYR